MSYQYSAYGLTISTPFLCPVLPSAPAERPPDITVTDGTVADTLGPQAFTSPDEMWQASAGSFLLRAGARAGVFVAKNGCQVTLQRSPNAEEHMLAFFFLDTVLAALLQQRGMVVLHANAAVTPAGAIAVSGVSGAGKSTTLAALLQRGCSMLADDITALRMDGAGQVLTLPGIPQMHLTEDSAAALGTDITSLPRYAWKRMKAAVPTRSAMYNEAVPLRALYLLETYAGDRLETRPLSGVLKFDALQKCIYGPLLAEEHPGKFALFAAIMNQVRIYSVKRPDNRWSLDELVDTILNPPA